MAYVIDFETKAIEPRPEYPPRPVGVAVRGPGIERYLAWGHPDGNNCTKSEASSTLRQIWRSGEELVFHNAKFDLDVAEKHLGLKSPRPEQVQDTMILAYLSDPHARRLGLKELAQIKLGEPPTERDAVRDWLVDRKIVSKANKKTWGAHICEAPAGLVGEYALGDVRRTAGLLENLLPAVTAAGMAEAYRRELRLIPVLLRNEREGVRVDLPRLCADVALYEQALQDAERRIYKLLGSTPNLDSGEEVADALDRKFPGIEWPLTEHGARSTSKEALAEVLRHQPPRLYALFVYHATVQTCCRTFMRPWMEVAERTGGVIHTQWNSVAQPAGGGTRTGRLSSTPNFQNIPTLKSRAFGLAIELHRQHLQKLGLPPLPEVRGYIVADSTEHVLLDRDFSQQELRMLAHFEGADMMEAYLRDPKLDLHAFAAELMFGSSEPQYRKFAKNIAFGLLYGMGIGALAELLGVSVAEAQQLRAKYLGAFSGIKDIQDDLKFRARNGLPMRTWGGRVYYVEPPKLLKGTLRHFDYKLFNYLIQGSSADLTKEAMLRYDAARRSGRLLLNVHDQLLICAPRRDWKREMQTLREAMEGLELDVPLLSDGAVGDTWTTLKGCE